MRRLLGHYAKFKIAKKAFDTGMRLYRQRGAKGRTPARTRASGRRVRA